jgi:hypothetical protein
MGSTASIPFSSSFSASQSLVRTPSISEDLSASTAEEHSGFQEAAIETSGSKKAIFATVEKHPLSKPERTKLTAIRLILEKERFMVAFLDIIQENGKREFYDFYEALESLKKITPSTKNPSMNYNIKALICSNRLLQDFYFNPNYVYNQYTTDELIHKKVMEACDSLLHYQEQMINIFTLHQIITNCQNALLTELVPEFDAYVETKYFKQVRILRTLSTKQFAEDFGRCLVVNNQHEQIANRLLRTQISLSQSASFSVSQSGGQEDQNKEDEEKLGNQLVSEQSANMGALARMHSI